MIKLRSCYRRSNEEILKYLKEKSKHFKYKRDGAKVQERGIKEKRENEVRRQEENTN